MRRILRPRAAVWFHRVLILLALCTGPGAAHAQSSDDQALLIDRLDLKDEADAVTLIVRLNAPVVLLTHAPREEGTELRLSLRLSIPDSVATDADETLQWTPTTDVPLSDVAARRTGEDAVEVAFRFTRVTRFEVFRQRDPRQIAIRFPHEVATPAQTPESTPRPPAVVTPPGAAPPMGAGNALLDDAAASLMAGDQARAVAIYTKVIAAGEEPWRQQALELRGVAHERKGRVAMARADYELYLLDYPQGEGAARVRQRLDALLTARERPRQARREGDPRERAEEMRWEVFGGFSQRYRRDENIVDTEDADGDRETEETVVQSTLFNDLDITAMGRSGRYIVRNRFTGGYAHDFLDGDTSTGVRVSSAYVDARDRERDIATRVGRQSRSKGGVFGRFDGALVDLPLTRVTKGLRFNGVAGLPVDRSGDNPDANRQMVAGSLEYDLPDGAWEGDVYALDQQVDGIVDRRVVGGELRYFVEGRSLFSLFDYDVYYDRVNTAMLLGNLTLPDTTSINLLLDYRMSPRLAATNALQGQTVEVISDLQKLLTTSEIHDQALDLTARSRLATLGFTRPLNEKFQINADATLSNFSSAGTPGAAGATDGTGNEYFYTTRLVGSSLIKEGDLVTFGVRYSEASGSNTVSFLANTRYPVNSAWRVSPAVRVDLRHYDSGDRQVTVAPGMRVSYRMHRKLQFEAEAGGELSNRELTDDTQKTRGWFAGIGYRWDF